jgi:hypothetical protein
MWLKGPFEGVSHLDLAESKCEEFVARAQSWDLAEPAACFAFSILPEIHEEGPPVVHQVVRELDWTAKCFLEIRDE